MSFSNSSHISVKGHASLTNVSGNQTNTTTIIGNVVHMQTKTTVGEDPMYAEFKYVNKGDIILGENLGSGIIEWRRKPRSISKGAHTVMSFEPRVWTDIFRVNLHPDQETPFTAFVYAGYSDRDAEEAWDKDFRRFARNRKRERVQLFGYNKWDIPMLIFHRDLIPIAHILSQSRSIWGAISAPHLARSITGSSARESDLWLDTKSGRFTEGPTGPWVFTRPQQPLFTLPSHTMEMFEENTCIHLYSRLADRDFDLTLLLITTSFPQVRKFLDCELPERNLHPPYSQTVNETIPWTLEYPYLKGLWLDPPHHLPLDDIGQLRFDTIYSPQLLPLARVPFCWMCGLMCSGLIMVGEMTRMTLDSVQIVMQKKRLISDWLGETWLSQATRIYNAHQPMSYGPGELLYIGRPWCGASFWIDFHDQQDFHLTTFFDLCDGMIEEHPAVYLFIYPPPLTISEYIRWQRSGTWRTHFWSFDEDGHSEIPEEECAGMDLPNIVLCHHLWYRIVSMSWPQHVYESLKKYQRARGFDPNTSDWAKSLGLPEVEIVGGREPSQGSACIQEIGDGESTSSFFEAGVGSGISAFGFC